MSRSVVEVFCPEAEPLEGRGRFRTAVVEGEVDAYAIQVAELRRAFVFHCAFGIEGVADKMLEMAAEGNIQAIKLVMSYGLGLPVRHAQPDSPERGTVVERPSVPEATVVVEPSESEAPKTSAGREDLVAAAFEDFWKDFPLNASGNGSDSGSHTSRKSRKKRSRRDKGRPGNKSTADASPGSKGRSGASSGNNSSPGTDFFDGGSGGGPLLAENLSVMDLIAQKNE